MRVLKAIRADPLFGKRMLFLAGHSRGGAAVILIAQALKKDKIFVDGLFLFDAVDRTDSTLIAVQTIPRNVRVTYHARRDASLSTYFQWGARDSAQKYLDCVNSNQTDPSAATAGACQGELELARKYQRLDDAMRVRMRANTFWSPTEGIGIDFGNCGLGIEPPCNIEEGRWPCAYKETKFLGSHGAIGGSAIGEEDDAWPSDEEKTRFEIIRNNDRAAMNSVWSWMTKNFAEANLDLHQSTTSHPTLQRPWQAPFP